MKHFKTGEGIWRWSRWSIMAMLLAASAFIVLAPSFASRFAEPVAYAGRVIIATPSQPGAGVLHVAFADDSFREHGVQAASQPVFSGSEALDALNQGKADLAVVPDTPFVMATMSGKSLGIVATVYRSRRSLAIIARDDRGITTPKDLAGKRIGVPFGTTAQFFLDTMMLVHGVREGDAHITDVPEKDLMASLTGGGFDAVAVWNPHLVHPEGGASFRHHSFHGEELYSYHLHLVGTREYLSRNQPLLRNILAALAEAAASISSEPSKAKHIIGLASNTDVAALDKTFDPGEFTLQLGQELLLALDDQSRWAMQRKLLPVRAMPNYLDHMDARPLSAVKPAAVTIIR
jgi:ABC-type nitrate/sulfonate/bicarbonate transport system substrate-binding protein